MPPTSLLPCAISELFLQVSQSGQLTLADRYAIMAAILNPEQVTMEEFQAIDRILHGLRKGQIRMVDKLSAV